MWQFERAVTGLADGCLELGIPVTGGNVSFYNQTGDVAIHPTPVVGVLGVIDDVERRTPLAFREIGDVVLLLGETRDELAGSEWAHVVHGHLGGLPPLVDLGGRAVPGAGARRGLAATRSSPRRTTSATPASRRSSSRWRCARTSVPRSQCRRTSSRSSSCSRSRPPAPS